jgi:excisionase family DNA binding protein
MSIENAVMTPCEVAKETHSSLRFIYKQMKLGNIPHIKLGDKYLISRSKFNQWLAGETANKEQ